jgi:toxoflavin biosynthesis protein ToxD
MSRSKLGRGKFDLMNPFSWMVRLPTEAEWQFAAAGPSAQMHPWGNSFDSRFANTYESGLGRSTAVGMYPAGAAECGALDLSGNAWEWTLMDYHYHVGEDGRAYRHGENEITSRSARAVRGGSWRDRQVTAQTANRHHGGEANRGVANGFRLVGRPFP